MSRQASPSEASAIIARPVDQDARPCRQLATLLPALSSRGEPALFRAAQTQLDALIAAAASLGRWTLLEEAVDAKLDEQAWFVRWWDESVRRPGGNTRSPIIVSRADTMDVAAATAQTLVTKLQVSRWRKSLADRARYRARIILAAYRKADLSPAANHRAECSGESEWYTPAPHLDAARAVMGGIDLDPASHPTAQQRVRAKRFYTREDDGLTKQWHGRVWLNPPYAQPLIGQFIEKLVTEVAALRATQAILLTNNSTDTAWFHLAAASAALICFTRGRIQFIGLDGDPYASPTQGQSFFYYGSDPEAFRSAFGAFGFVR
jgi:phage N-6-adenine-methyltransferase